MTKGKVIWLLLCFAAFAYLKGEEAATYVSYIVRPFSDTVYITRSENYICLEKPNRLPYCTYDRVPVRGQKVLFVNETGGKICLTLFVEKGAEKDHWEACLNPEDDWWPKQWYYAYTNWGDYNLRIIEKDVRGNETVHGPIKIRQF